MISSEADENQIRLKSIFSTVNFYCKIFRKTMAELAAALFPSNIIKQNKNCFQKRDQVNYNKSLDQYLAIPKKLND